MVSSSPRCLLVQACCLNLSAFLSGLSTYNSVAGSTRINSPLLMLELVRAVAFAATAGVAELDAHCLMDNPHKGGHDCYFDRFGKAQLSPLSPLSVSLSSREQAKRVPPTTTTPCSPALSAAGTASPAAAPPSRISPGL